MELYKNRETNPFASCLPILLQMPIFFALFRVLNGTCGASASIGPFDDELAQQADSSAIFGAQLSVDVPRQPATHRRKSVTVVLIILMSASQFFVQKKLMTKNMSAARLDSPFVKQQKMLLYILPLVFAVTGVDFPIGVLLYWCITNL